MRTNHVKQKLRQGEPCFGTWITMGSLHATRILARCGFDWLTLDLEHAPLDWGQTAILLAAIADAGCAPLVRVPEGTITPIKRALDAGAWGIIVPMVNTAEQAQAAVAAAKYPPEGVRSAGGGMHALNFAAPLEEYYLHANREVLIVLQIESPEGVAHIDQILATPGCDAVFVGPVDLRFTLRKSDGSFPAPEEHEAAISRVLQAARNAGVPAGIHCFDAGGACARAKQGFQLLAIGSDLRMLCTELERTCSTLWPERPLRVFASY